MALLIMKTTSALAMFYYTLGNISPKFRSTTKMIQLVAVTKYTVLEEYGFNEILQPFMVSIRSLESVWQKLGTHYRIDYILFIG